MPFARRAMTDRQLRSNVFLPIGRNTCFVIELSARVAHELYIPQANQEKATSKLRL
jgi:hypothetical protein